MVTRKMLEAEIARLKYELNNKEISAKTAWSELKDEQKARAHEVEIYEAELDELKFDLQIMTESRNDWQTNYDTLSDNNEALRAELAKYKPKWQTGKPTEFGRYLCEGYYFNQSTHSPHHFLLEWFEGELNNPFILRWAGPIQLPEEEK
jgi:hypothetical protein